MFRCNLFLLLVPILLRLVHAASCTSLFDIVLLEQRRYLSYQQRGLSYDFVQPFYSSFLLKLGEFIKDKYPGFTFSETCLTELDITDIFEGYYNRSAIDDQLQLLLARYPKLAYIPRSKQPQIPIDNRFEYASSYNMDKTVNALMHNNYAMAAYLPETVSVFYDPDREKVLEMYKAHASFSPMMEASRFLRIVTAMVINLELSHVPKEPSIQLLRHAVAWLSTSFRALQKDGPDTKVPVNFLPMYKEVARKLQKGSNLRVHSAKGARASRALRTYLEIYCRLDAWGKLEVVDWNDNWNVWTIEKLLYDPIVLKSVTEYSRKEPSYTSKLKSSRANLGLPSLRMNRDFPPQNKAVDRVEISRNGSLSKETGSVPSKRRSGRTWTSLNVTSREAARNVNVCSEPTYHYVAMTVSNWEEACCASICCNISLMLMAGSTQEQCCQICNQHICNIEGSSLESLAVVHLEPYGFDAGGAVPVSI